jgi:phosphoribosylformylglycinamidine cyclo-ligase
VLPDGLEAVIEMGSWPVPPIFTLIMKQGEVEEAEAHRTFNMGIGFVVFVRPNNLDDAMAELRAVGEKAYVIGRVRSGAKAVRLK